jgi:hypothetical protein
MELWVIWDEHSEGIETWAETFFGIQRTLRPPTGRLVVEYLSVVLVAGGIIGELGISIKIASVNSQLRSVDTQLRSKNAELRTASDQLIGLLHKEAEDEALARAELEAEFVKQEPRFTLLRWRRPYLVSKVKRFPRQRFTTLTEAVPTDTEVTRAASELTVMLEYDAGWVNNIPHASWNPGNMFDTGLVVRILPNAAAETRRAASALFKALNEVLVSGVQFADNGQDVKRILPGIPFDEQTVLIEVGEHPTPLSPPHAKEDAKKTKTLSK